MTCQGTHRPQAVYPSGLSRTSADRRIVDGFLGLGDDAQALPTDCYGAETEWRLRLP